jgi:glucose-6-phosphate 1-dehydrogenase
MIDAASLPTGAQAHPAPPATLVVFGAAGDLTRRLLVPALYNLAAAKLLPNRFAVIGIARKDQDNDGFRRDLAATTREFATTTVEPGIWRWLSDRLYYVQGDFAAPDT